MFTHCCRYFLRLIGSTIALNYSEGAWSEWLTKKLAVPPERPSSKASSFTEEGLSAVILRMIYLFIPSFMEEVFMGHPLYIRYQTGHGDEMVNKTERSVPSLSLYSSEEERESLDKQRITQDAFRGAQCYKGISRVVQESREYVGEGHLSNDDGQGRQGPSGMTFKLNCD